MKFALGVIVASLVWVGILYMVPMPEERVKIYDCGMAEWHPDIPKEIKEACRNRQKESRQGLTI